MRSRLAARGLPAETYAAWRDSLQGSVGAPARVLAWARADDDGVAIGSPALFSVGASAHLPAAGEPAGPRGSGESGQAEEPDDAPAPGAGWRHLGWHEIEHGGWNAESRSLSWTLYGGRRGRVGLPEPGRLPELFRERVAASIVVERFVPIRGERGVTVTARRDLGGSGAITWHSTLTRGLSWSTPGVTEEAARASAELQSEYGSASAGW